MRFDPRLLLAKLLSITAPPPLNNLPQLTKKELRWENEEWSSFMHVYFINNNWNFIKMKMGISMGLPTLRKQTLKDLISFIIAQL